VKAEIRKLKAERDLMIARMQSAQARLGIQDRSRAFHSMPEVKALDHRSAHQEHHRAGQSVKELPRVVRSTPGCGAQEPEPDDVRPSSTLPTEGQAAPAAAGTGQRDVFKQVSLGAPHLKFRPAKPPFEKPTVHYITLGFLPVVGYTAWHFEGSEIRKWAAAEQSASQTQPAVSAGDFDALQNAPPDPSRGAGSTGGPGSTLAGPGKTEAAPRGGNQTPGRAFGRALSSNNGPSRLPAPVISRSTHGREFVLLEDPARSWLHFGTATSTSCGTRPQLAREASILEEQQSGG